MYTFFVYTYLGITVLKNNTSLSLRVFKEFYSLLFILSGVLLITPDCEALQISGGTRQRHERFYQGADKDFLASQLDWSGVGRSVGPGRTPWLTMISPSYFISSAHFAPDFGEPIIFNHTNDPNGPSEQHARKSVRLFGGTDTLLGKLSTPVSDKVAKYAIYPLLDNLSDYRNKEIYLVGRSPFTQPSQTQFDVAIGRNSINSVSSISRFNEFSLKHSFDPSSGFSPDEAGVVTGDSGAPSFILEGNQLALISTHWGVRDDAFLPSHLRTIRSIVEAGGESLVEFVPEPTSLGLIVLSMMGLGLGRDRSKIGYTPYPCPPA